MNPNYPFVAERAGHRCEYFSIETNVTWRSRFPVFSFPRFRLSIVTEILVRLPVFATLSSPP